EDLTGAAIGSVWLRALARKSSAPPPPRVALPSRHDREATTHHSRVRESAKGWLLVAAVAIVAAVALLAFWRTRESEAKTTVVPESPRVDAPAHAPPTPTAAASAAEPSPPPPSERTADEAT